MYFVLLFLLPLCLWTLPHGSRHILQRPPSLPIPSSPGLSPQQPYNPRHTFKERYIEAHHHPHAQLQSPPSLVPLGALQRCGNEVPNLHLELCQDAELMCGGERLCADSNVTSSGVSAWLRIKYRIIKGRKRF